MRCTGAAVPPFLAMESRSPPPGERKRYPNEAPPGRTHYAWLPCLLEALTPRPLRGPPPRDGHGSRHRLRGGEVRVRVGLRREGQAERPTPFHRWRHPLDTRPLPGGAAAAAFFRDPDGHLLELIGDLTDEPRSDFVYRYQSEWRALFESNR